MATNDVKILVKNVYVPAESQQFVVVDSLQVRTLKEMIATALPGNPLPKHQKLIFGGKICDDNDTLAKVLAGQNKDVGGVDAAGGENAAAFVFHLMVSSSVPRSRPTTPVTRPEPTTAQPPVTPAPVPVPGPATATVTGMATPHDATATVGATPTTATHPPTNPHVPPVSPFVGFFGAAPATTASSTVPPGAAAHHGNHHHFYTQAVLMQQQAMVLSQIQYLQQLQTHHASAAQANAAHGASAAAPPPAHGAFPAYGHFGHHFAHQAYGMPHYPHPYGAHPAAHAGAFPAPHAFGMQYPGAAVPPAAVPAAAEPRERGPIVHAFREILPLFDIRLAMKMAFMLFIIGQDTPTDRLIVLALMSFGAYLHITGILGKVFEILKRSRGVQEGNENANAEPGANIANPNGAPNAQDRLGSITRHLRISADRGLIHDVRYFLTGLLLSLVPAWHPQPLNADPAAPARQEPGLADAAPELPLQGI